MTNELQTFVGEACDKATMKSSIPHYLSSKGSIKTSESENHDCGVDIVSSEQHVAEPHFRENPVNKNFHDLSQISGPDRLDKSDLTPLSQIGFRDSASIGAGQQLTLISIEVRG